MKSRNENDIWEKAVNLMTFLPGINILINYSGK
jgi:hypothetical protein